MDGGKDGDDDDGDLHGDDADEDGEEEEEEHLAPADFTIIVPTVEFVSQPEGTNPVTPPPFTDITTTGARITVRLQASISLLPEAEVKRLLAMPTPPSSPLISPSPPSAGECLARCMTPSAHSSPLPVPSPLLPSSGCPTLYPGNTQDSYTLALLMRDDIPESERPPRKRSCLFALGSREVGYGIRDTWVDLAEAVPKIAPMTVGEETVLIVEEEAYASREAWAYSVGMSQTVHYELQTHRTDGKYSPSDERHEIESYGYQAGTVLALLESSRGELDNQDQMLEFQIHRMLLEMSIVTSSDLCHFTLRGPNTPPNNTNPNNITPESVQAMIDQALQRNSTNGDGGHRNEGVVGLTWWIEKMESFFNISGCAIENQVKFATCTLLGAALTWWNGQIKENLRSRCMIRYFGKYSRKKMSDKYCSAGRNQRKLEIEFLVRNLKVKGE
ncbi:hypothetical protein Tco_0247858 [Tanacetum coccineum]